MIVGDGLGELTLDGRLLVETVDDLLGECLVGGHVFRRQDNDARSEAVTERVHAGARPALRRGGTLGLFSIEAVGWLRIVVVTARYLRFGCNTWKMGWSVEVLIFLKKVRVNG